MGLAGTQRWTLALPLAAVVVLSACGGGDNKDTKATTPQASAPAAAATAASTGTTAASVATTAPTPAQVSRTFTDDNGKTLTIAQPPKRVVALSPSMVELLYAVDAPPIARPSSANFPEAAKALPAVGNSYNPSIEQVAAQQPDLILADQQIQRPDLIAQLEKIAPVFAIRVLTVDDVLKGLRTAGRISGKQEQGDKAAKDIEDKISAVQAKVPQQRPSVFIMIGAADSFFAAKPNSFIGDVVGRLGGNNLVKEGPDDGGFPGFTTYSLEKLVQLNPDVILVATAGPPGAPKASQVLASNPAWSGLKAVKAGRVYEVDPVTLVQSAGPRVSKDIDEVAKALYPSAN
ncbi:MAG: ABC transporter substrate-binding protein [Chloroflexi bacterium]|nr:ABC transporter substrate-binding protein [Chloroflexota bacterium]